MIHNVRPNSALTATWEIWGYQPILCRARPGRRTWCFLCRRPWWSDGREDECAWNDGDQTVPVQTAARHSDFSSCPRMHERSVRCWRRKPSRQADQSCSGRELWTPARRICCWRSCRRCCMIRRDGLCSDLQTRPGRTRWKKQGTGSIWHCQSTGTNAGAVNAARRRQRNKKALYESETRARICLWLLFWHEVRPGSWAHNPKTTITKQRKMQNFKIITVQFTFIKKNNLIHVWH